MLIEIATSSIEKLGNKVPEIRVRAIGYIQSKFQCCRTDLNDLVVDVDTLVRFLLRWFRFKPVTHQKQVLEILLTLLKSKHSSESIAILNKYNERGEIKALKQFVDDRIARDFYDEIICILDNNQYEKRWKNNISPPSTYKSLHSNMERFSKHSENGGGADECHFENAWSTPHPSDLRELSMLKAALTATTKPYTELQHSLQHFHQCINDFPGEFYLQHPFIYSNILDLIESNNEADNCADALRCCLRMTQNLERRVIVRRLSSASQFAQKSKDDISESAQVTIATYCSETFSTIIKYLRHIYCDRKLAIVNECFLILISLVDLICKSAISYSTAVEVEYGIESIIEQLADFLSFIRQLTHEYRYNGTKTQRNNSISLVFLLCRLLLFKKCDATESSIQHEDKLSPLFEDTINSNIIQQIKQMTLNSTKDGHSAHSFMSPFGSFANASVHGDNDSQLSSCLQSVDHYHTACDYNQIHSKQLWRSEFEMVLLDYALQHYYPDLFTLVKDTLEVYTPKECAMPHNDFLKILNSLQNVLGPAVHLLKEPNVCSDEMVINFGVQAIDALEIVKSSALIRFIFDAIANSTSLFSNDVDLREKAEKLLLHMIVMKNVELKRLIYKLCSEKVAYFICSLMNGRETVSKLGGSSLTQAHIFGLPLTTDILIEVICNGSTNTDKNVETFSENMLISIVRSQQLLQTHRKIAAELFLPILPLLVSLALSPTKLGQLISSIIDPDADNRMPTITLIKSNIVWLYSRDNHFRSEGLNRLSYMLQKMETAAIYLPNINHMTDVLQPNLCLVNPIAPNMRDEFNNIHEYDSLPSLLTMLSNSVGLDRSVRHQALAQIDFMAVDAKCTDVFHKQNGCQIILFILDKALQVNSYAQYGNDAALVISILRKVCMRIAQARLQLSSDVQTYVLVLRALLLYQHDDRLRRNGAALLFMLAFNEYIACTTNDGFNVPSIIKKLNVPIECEYGWKSSTNDLFSALLYGNEPNQICIDSFSHTPLKDHTRQPNDYNNKCWRYIRMAFAAIWFGSLDNCNHTSNYMHGKHLQLNYKINPNAFEFNELLHIEREDLEIIEASSSAAGIKYWMKDMQNATSAVQVTNSLAAIESFSNVGMVGYRAQWDCSMFLDGIRRFCTTAPNTKSDQQLFISICRLLTNLIERDSMNILLWILGELNRDKCVFMEVLVKLSKTNVYIANVQLVEATLAKTIQLPEKKHFEQLIFWSTTREKKLASLSTRADRKPNTHSNMYEKIFDILIKLLDEMIMEKRFVEFGCLVSLLRVVTSSAKISADCYTTSFVANKLLKLIAALNSFYHVGSMFVKNCLLTVGNLMLGVDELRIEDKHLELLIVLCSHTEFEIRSFSWNILLKIATNLRQTTKLLQIATKKGLPNGLYSCSLHTLLDDEESAIVRENAGFVFATLLMQYKNCTVDERIEYLIPKNAASNWLELLLKHYQLFEQVTSSLDHLYVEESCIDQLTKPIVPCNLMRSYCVVLQNILPLNVVEVRRFLSVSVEMCRVIKQAVSAINKPSILLVIEVCTLINKCITINEAVVEFIVRDRQVVQKLISYLNVSLFCNIPNKLRHPCWTRVMKLLRRIIDSTSGFQIICESYSDEPDALLQTVATFIYCLGHNEINLAAMKYFGKLLITSQSSNYKFTTFAQQINKLYLTPQLKESLKPGLFGFDIQSQSLFDWFDMNNELPRFEWLATTIVYRQLSDSFTHFGENMITDNHAYEYTCQTIEALLKCSPSVRKLADDENFMLAIIEHMMQIFDAVHGSFSDYIRQYGNAKAQKYLNKLKLLLNMTLSWYSCECMLNEECIERLVSICSKLFPTIGVSSEVHCVFLKMLLFVSDDSLPVCKATTKSSPSSKESLLQAIIHFCENETARPKTSETNLNHLQLAMSVVSNCCCCHEGRSLIGKLRMFQTLSNLHPQVTRNQKFQHEISWCWLKLFEVFTRYEDSNKECHINLLCTFAESKSYKHRRIALEILRNFAFNSNNRSALLTSSDFVRIAYSTLSDRAHSEQLLITVAIWKLIVHNNKAKNVIKNSSIYSKLRQLKESVGRLTSNSRQLISASGKIDYDDGCCDSIQETVEDLSTALDCVLNILQF